LLPLKVLYAPYTASNTLFSDVKKSFTVVPFGLFFSIKSLLHDASDIVASNNMLVYLLITIFLKGL
jgi:hypothetical protein